eukprot:162352-Amphidinium_carterae.1
MILQYVAGTKIENDSSKTGHCFEFGAMYWQGPPRSNKQALSEECTLSFDRLSFGARLQGLACFAENPSLSYSTGSIIKRHVRPKTYSSNIIATGSEPTSTSAYS